MYVNCVMVIDYSCLSLACHGHQLNRVLTNLCVGCKSKGKPGKLLIRADLAICELELVRAEFIWDMWYCLICYFVRQCVVLFDLLFCTPVCGIV